MLALGALLFIAISDVIQQRIAHDVTDEWLGSLVAVVGFGLQAAALSVTSLGEVLRPGRAGWLTLVVAAIVLIAGTVVRPRSEAVTSRDPRTVTPQR